MKENILYASSILKRLSEIRRNEHASHGLLMNFEGYISAGLTLNHINYNEYSVLMNIAKNAYENNPSKLP